jgi:hypothetical protein
MIKLKPGVNVHGVGTEIVLALIIAERLYAEKGKDCIVTSVIDGHHSRTSLHYTGDAVDLRTFILDQSEQKDIASRLKEALGIDYDVVLERDHLHIEYQPRGS